MKEILKKLRGEPGQWGVATAAVGAYILASENGDYKTCCLTLLALLVASLAIFRDNGGRNDGAKA